MVPPMPGKSRTRAGPPSSRTGSLQSPLEPPPEGSGKLLRSESRVCGHGALWEVTAGAAGTVRQGREAAQEGVAIGQPFLLVTAPRR